MIDAFNALTPEELAVGIQWLTQNSNFPTFDEFRKNPDAYRDRPDDLFVAADGSTQTFRKALTKQTYSWKDEYRADSLEKIERIAKEEGFAIDQLEMEPLVQSVSGTNKEGPVEILIRFWPKEEFKARGGVVANDS